MINGKIIKDFYASNQHFYLATNHGDPSIINKKKRKKKVKQATIEEIEVPEDEPPSGMYKKPEPQSANKQIEGQ